MVYSAWSALCRAGSAEQVSLVWTVLLVWQESMVAAELDCWACFGCQVWTAAAALASGRLACFGLDWLVSTALAAVVLVRTVCPAYYFGRFERL